MFETVIKKLQSDILAKREFAADTTGVITQHMKDRYAQEIVKFERAFFVLENEGEGKHGPDCECSLCDGQAEM